jgi:NAD(P)H-hydrate epimerase
MKNLVSATTSQMREIDRVATQEYGLQVVQMMENAGRALARLCRLQLEGIVERRRILVLAGGGKNAGGGLAAARNLHNWGADVEIALAVRDDSLKRSAVIQFNVLESMDVPFIEASALGTAEIQGFDLIVDALLGYGIEGDPAAEFAHLIILANKSKKPVVALDIPSGLDASTGKPFDPCIRASATMTLAVPKTGLLESTAAEFVGELWLADIGIPPEVLVKVGLQGENPFAEDDLVLVDRKKKAVAITA